MTSSLGRNYARAIFEPRREAGSLDAIESDLRAARDVLYTDIEARAFLANRLIGAAYEEASCHDARRNGGRKCSLFLLSLLVQRATDASSRGDHGGIRASLRVWHAGCGR